MEAPCGAHSLALLSSGLMLAYQALVDARRGLTGYLGASLVVTEVPSDVLAFLRLEDAGLDTVQESLEEVKQEGIKTLGRPL